ncbi:MAG: hypothetical protein KDK65_03475 [Chlamydiia bacterium]|nr:hypothetical protein [Chlamydiia bacterium]
MKRVLIFLLLSSCQSCPEQIHFATHIMDAYKVEAKRMYDANLFGTGGSFQQQIEKFSLYFSIQQATSRDHAIHTYTQLIDRFINTVNHSSKLRSKLIAFPIDYRHVELTLIFPNALLCNQDHVVHYLIDDVDKGSFYLPAVEPPSLSNTQPNKERNS